MSAETPKQKEKAVDAIAEPETILEAEVVEDIDQTKKKSSASGAELTKALPQPPAPAQPKGRSLLTTDTGEDVQFLDDESDEDVEIDLIANHREKEKVKPRMSFSFRFFGGGNKNKKKIHKDKAARPGSMFAFLMPKPANSTYNNMKGGKKGKIESEDSRIDSVAWRRKESIEMTKSLKMDMDIYQYLKERSPSFEEEEKIDIDEPAKSLIPPPKVKRKGKKGKGGTTSNLLVGGNVREATKAPHLEMQRRKKKGFFGRFKIFGRSKESGKPGFASRMLSRMSFRPTSYTETTADEMRKLLEETEAKGNKDEELYRKDSDDSNASDETDLSADIDIDSTLLVKDSDVNTPKAAVAAVAEDEEPGRVSKIFDEDEDKPKTNAAVLKSEMSKSSDELVVVKPLQTSSKSTEGYLEDEA